MRIFRSLFIVVCLMVITTMIVSAAPLAAATTKMLSTNYTVVNLSTTDATVTASYYKPDGSAWVASPQNTSFTVKGNYGQQIVSLYFDTTLTAGQGSVVLTSSQPLGAVTQILARNQVPSSGAYSGITAPAARYYAPQVFANLPSAAGLQNSQIAIQNTTAAAITVNVEFVPFPGISGLSAYTKSGISIAAGAAFLYDLSNEANLKSTNATVKGWTGSAVVSATSGTVAVVVNTFAGVNSLQTYNAFPSTDITDAWSIPQFTSKLPNGLNTPIIAQNLSGGDIPVGDVTLTCVAATGYSPATLVKKNEAVVPNNGTFAFNPYGNAAYPNNWSGTCTMKSATGKGMVAIVQMRKPGFSDELAAYEGLKATSTSKKVIVPLVSKNQANGFATAVTIKNLDTDAGTTVHLVYTPAAAYVAGGGSATPVTIDATIPANGNLIQSQRFTGTPEIPNGWYGSLVVTSDTTPIGALVQLSNVFAQPGDTYMAHNAFTQ